MKKVVMFLFVLLMAVCLFFSIAIAEDGTATPGFGGSFFSWETIGTFSGAVALVVFLVQVLKLPLDKVYKIPTRFVVYVISLAVLVLAQAFVPALGGLTWQSGVLCVFNAALVALSAMSVYGIAIEGPETAKMVDELVKGAVSIDEVPVDNGLHSDGVDV